MKIKEIVSIPSREEDIAKYNYLFDGSVKVPTPLLGLTFSTASDDSYGLFNSDKLVGILLVDSERLDLPQIMYTQTSTDFRGKGLLRYLFNQAIQHHSILYSDTHQTAESEYFWRNLLIHPESAYTISVYNQDTGIESKIDKTRLPDIWHDEVPILVARLRIRTNEQHAMMKHNNAVRSRFNRSDFNLFYGPYSLTSDYRNP